MQLKIISFNIWDLPLWFVRDRKNRIAALIEYLTQTGADIICIQESWDTKNRPLFRKALEGAGYQYASGSERHAWLGNGGLVTFSKYPILSKKFFRFTPYARHFIEMFTGRGILETIIETPRGPLRVLNTHLHMPGWFQDQKIRLRQLEQAFVFIDWSNPTTTILAGDFNEHNILEHDGFARLFTKEKFSHPLVGEHSLAPTYRVENKFVQEWINRLPISQRYDYIFAHNLDKLNLQVEKYKPVYLDPVLSDHDPVLLSLKSVPRILSDSAVGNPTTQFSQSELG